MATTAERIEAIDACIDQLIAGGGVQRYVVGGKDITHYSLPQLEALKASYQRTLRQESGSRMGFLRRKPVRDVGDCDSC